MTDLLHSGRPAAVRASLPRITWIPTLYVVTAAAAVAGLYVAARAAPSVRLEWQLALVLRFMAAVKAAMLLGAIGLKHWRLRAPIDDRFASGYVVGLALMSMAPALIWSLAHVALGAVLFHAGLLIFLVVAWRDDAPGRLLSQRARRS